MPTDKAAALELDPFRRQHAELRDATVEHEHGTTTTLIDDAESPLGWLARRRGRDGRPLIAPHQFQAGERLRAEFTCAHLMPRTTSNWGSAIPTGRRSGGTGVGHFSDTVIAARQRVHQALDAAGPEFAGVLMDVCCFLKRLEDIERERAWPARSAKVVLQLALDRLARHFGYAGEARGATSTGVRTWLAEDAEFVMPQL